MDRLHCAPVGLYDFIYLSFNDLIIATMNITIDPNKRSGKPCVRGLRITVYDVLEYLASEMTQEEILKLSPRSGRSA